MQEPLFNLPLFEISMQAEPEINKEFGDEHIQMEKVVNFAVRLLTQSTPTTDEFIKILTNYFGYYIRLYIFEIVENLLKDERLIIYQYALNNLSKRQIEKALEGARPPKQKEESTLDELFARSLELRTPAKLIEVMNFVAKIKKYSPFNNMLVYLQRPNATYWATASHWQKAFGRTVKQNVIPIIMLQPMSPVMLVYDVVDTEGKPLPKGIGDIFAVDGHFDAETYKMTLKNCQRLKIFVSDVELREGHAGTAIKNLPNSDFKLSIEINQRHELKTKYVTLCHELAHIFLGHLGGDPSGKDWFSRIGMTRNQHELEAESVAYLVCRRAGLEARSADYLSIYLKDEKDIGKISVELIMKTAGKIEEMGKKLIRLKESSAT